MQAAWARASASMAETRSIDASSAVEPIRRSRATTLLYMTTMQKVACEMATVQIDSEMPRIVRNAVRKAGKSLALDLLADEGLDDRNELRVARTDPRGFVSGGIRNGRSGGGGGGGADVVVLSGRETPGD